MNSLKKNSKKEIRKSGRQLSSLDTRRRLLNSSSKNVNDRKRKNKPNNILTNRPDRSMKSRLSLSDSSSRRTLTDRESSKWLKSAKTRLKRQDECELRK